MKRAGLLFFCILLSFAVFSFRTKGENFQENPSAVILKLRYKSPGLSGHDGTLRLRNIETNAVYEGKSRMGFNPFIVIAKYSQWNIYLLMKSRL